MTCNHLRQLYDLCERENVRLSSSDLIQIVCTQCGKQEVCPSNLSEHLPEDAASSESAANGTDAETS